MTEKQQQSSQSTNLSTVVQGGRSYSPSMATPGQSRSESVSPSSSNYYATVQSPDDGRSTYSPSRYGSSYTNYRGNGSRYGGNGGYNSYGNGYNSYGYGNSYGNGGYGGYNGYGYGGYGNGNYVGGGYGPGANQGPIRPGENTLGYLHHLTDDCGRFAGLLTANADALHGSFASLLGLLEMCSMIYHECGYIVSGFTLIRFINRFFGWILGESSKSNNNRDSFAAEFSAKRRRGYRWGNVLVLLVVLSVGIPAIRALFRKLSQFMKEEEEKHRKQQQLLIQQHQQQQQHHQPPQHLSQQRSTQSGRNYNSVR